MKSKFKIKTKMKAARRIAACALLLALLLPGAIALSQIDNFFYIEEDVRDQDMPAGTSSWLGLGDNTGGTGSWLGLGDNTGGTGSMAWLRREHRGRGLMGRLRGRQPASDGHRPSGDGAFGLLLRSGESQERKEERLEKNCRDAPQCVLDVKRIKKLKD